MLKINAKTLIICAHIDDEFAMAPIIKAIARKNPKNIRVTYCAERNNDPIRLKKLRREESFKSNALLGVKEKNIDFLNNKFVVDDLKLYISAEKIYSYMKNLNKKFKYEQILTLNYEGGHPDHDSLALLVNKFSKNNSKISVFFPAYNSREILGIPLSVFKPLRNQESFFSSIKLGFFGWFDTLKIAYIYKSEWKAFLKLLPFLFLNFILSRKIYFSNIINLESVNWSRSLSFNIYKTEFNKILNSIEKLK